MCASSRRKIKNHTSTSFSLRHAWHFRVPRSPTNGKHRHARTRAGRHPVRRRVVGESGPGPWAPGALGLGVTHALTRSVGAGAGLRAAEASARLRPSAIGFTLRHASHTATQCAGARPCQTATEQAPALDGKELTRPQTGAHRRGWVCESALEPAADHGVQEAGGSGPRSR